MFCCSPIFIDMKKCKLLSFDSSTKSTGYAIFTNGNYTKSGRIDFSKEKIMFDRTVLMIEQILKLLDEYKPDIVVWETPHYYRDPETHLCLGIIIGAIIGYCVKTNTFYCPFRASEWRKYIGKHPTKRDEVKLWGIEKVKELYGIEVEKDDESDAILIGRAYVNKWGEINE